MAVTSIQNVGGFKGGDTGCLEAQRKPSEGEVHDPKACSTQPASPNTLRKSSYELSAPLTTSLSRLNTDNYNEITNYIGSDNRRPSLAHKIGSNWTGYTPPPPPCRHSLQSPTKLFSRI